ncbi:MAG: MBL fold metallo-hydrolase [Planctomycetota bacterium]|jgi:glyoxylase-like metal-dependent hydrolase (beta-lactamase superfamily II)
MSLMIDAFVTGPLMVSTYVLRCDGQCCVVDPGSMGRDALIDALSDWGADVDQIWLTHGHGDHIAGVVPLKQMFPAATVTCSAVDAPLLNDPRANLSAAFGLSVTAPAPDSLVQPHQTLSIGPSQWTVLDTAGHTAGGVSFYCPDEAVVLTGDALFAGSIGRTDIPGGDLPTLITNIERALLSLPGQTRVLPGHGGATTIEAERRHNPFLSGLGQSGGEWYN